jgi:hypothetical protein
MSPLGGCSERPVDDRFKFSFRARAAIDSIPMNDDDETALEALKAEHRQLDEQIRVLSSEPIGDQLELARLKRRKLRLKDEIQLLLDSNTPDIIA